MAFQLKLARYNDKAEELLGIKFKSEPWLHIAAVQIKSGDYSYAIYVWDTRKIVNSGHLNPRQVKVFEADELSPCLDNHTDIQGAPVAKAINAQFKTERDYDKGEQQGHEICGWYPEHIRIFPLKDEVYFVKGKRCKIEMYKKDKETYVFRFINAQNGSAYITTSMKVKDDTRGGLAIAKAKLIRAFEIKPYMYPEEKAELGIEAFDDKTKHWYATDYDNELKFLQTVQKNNVGYDVTDTIKALQDIHSKVKAAKLDANVKYCTALPKDKAGGWRIYIAEVPVNDLKQVFGDELKFAGKRPYIAY